MHILCTFVLNVLYINEFGSLFFSNWIFFQFSIADEKLPIEIDVMAMQKFDKGFRELFHRYYVQNRVLLDTASNSPECWFGPL